MATAALLLALPAAGFSQSSEEIDEGRTLGQALRAGDRDCSDLGEDQFQAIGEYAMDRYLGNRAVHKAMNVQMTRMMGARGERSMHVALGHRYTGCPGGPSGRWTMPMLGMMNGNYPGSNGGDYGPMMGGRNGAPGRMHRSSSGDDGTSALEIAAIGLGAALVGGLLMLLGMRFRHGAGRGGPAS